MVADPPPALPTPLSDLRVMDLSGNLAGPYCGQILADMGADVIKVERPGAGDPARAWTPPAWGSDGTLYLASNRGKRSLALELGTPEAGMVLDRLLQEADVVIQAFRPDVARRFGLTEEVLRPRYPSVILCTISAFDPEGPHADRPGYDPLLQAHTGLMSVTGPEGGPPVRVGTSLVDLGAGMWGAIGILGALRVRDQTGEGTHVQVTLEDTGLAWSAYHLMGAMATGRAPGPMGTGLGMISPYRAFSASDGFLMIAAGNDALFRRLCHALDLPGLAADPRFATNPLRVENREALEEALGQACRSRSRAELEALLLEAGVPCAPIRDMAEVAGDQDSLGRALRPEPHPRLPDYRAVALPPRWDGARADPRRHPPAVGEHTYEILEEAGFSRDEVKRLMAAGVVWGPLGG
jgi:crotonobetainyl-CoA:carnitine CoA-transferase CaiB-like acyl-CoA transferase